MKIAGIDVGYRSTKVVILEDEKVLVREEADIAEIAFTKALERINLSKDMVTYITATGVGRESVTFAQKYTPDVVVIAKGAFFHFPSIWTRNLTLQFTLSATYSQELILPPRKSQ